MTVARFRGLKHSKDQVAYFLNENISAFHYGEGHPMKPARLALTHNLVCAYGLHKKMTAFRPRAATEDEITSFHEADYVEFLKRITPDNVGAFSKYLHKFNLGVDDCPVFDGLYRFCSMYTGASLEAARKLTSGSHQIAINWSGGLHHAKKWEASGFCYINDIVIAILELLRTFPRVVYVDIDVHHGDGVQEAFYRSNRVMTVSFHRYDGTFFPGTGDLSERGAGPGSNFAINVPLTTGITDAQYSYIFKAIMTDVMAKFQPGAIVLQCGADSLAADRLGSFNLSIEGHGACVKFMKSFNIPLILVGGGGYTVRNVARAWTYETSIITSSPLENQLPDNPYMAYYAPDYLLHPPIQDSSIPNGNTRQKLDQVREKVAEYLRYVESAPSVMMQEIPPGVEKLEQGLEVDKVEDELGDMRVDDIGLFYPISKDSGNQ
ncbi:histone deacetylase-3 [Gaertneriomyces semiglobifer]|nr:histone deacetylase-3 [Gaertneriomyces semiglobifer]